uniref:Bm10949 n=2 Tax=Brugia TaxID=6278 RepID=A0A0J9Y256_BRUMA|nr:Bm10949 [Brugia malayi]
MPCSFRARVNQLWSIWYTIVMVLLQTYLIYLGFERYRLYSEMKWPHGAYPSLWLSVYVVLYSSCIPGLLLFMAFGIFKSGNVAGDNDRLGARIDRVIEITRNSYRKGRCSLLRCIKSLWQHAPPLPQLIHLSMALFQLFAQQVMLSQLYRYGFINSGDFLNTELDFVYQRARQLAANLPMLDNRLQGFRISAQDLAATPISPNLLPILMHARLFGIPLEFVNLLIALFVYTCTYSAVFWHTNKPFSFIFSLHLLIYSTTIIWSYLGFSVLHRIQETSYSSIRPIGLGQYLISSRPLKIYHPSTIIATYVMTIVLISTAPVALYMYGYSKYFISMSNVRQKSAFQNQTSSINGAQSEYSEYRLRSSSKVPQARLCCDGYAPHIFAIILLVLIVITKAPTIYAHMVIYQHEEKALLLSCIVVDIVFLFAWIILWLILTLKRDWNFKVVHQVHEIIALQNGPQTMIASPKKIMEKKPSELKNSLILMHGDQMYLTDDTIAKKSLLRQTQKNVIGTASEDIYWLKGNNTQSPTTRRVPQCESVKETLEMNRLLGPSAVHRQSSDGNSSPTAAYHTISHTIQSQMTYPSRQRIIMNIPKYSSEAKVSANVTMPGNTFATFQRAQGSEFASGSSRQMMQNPRRPSLQNSMSACTENNTSDITPLTQQEAYASILKSRTGQTETITRRRGSKDDGAVNTGFGNVSVSYGTHTTYGRPQNQRLIQQAAVQAAQVAQVSRNKDTVYNRTQTNTSQNVLESGPTSSVLSIRSSPVAENRLGTRTSISSREHSPYQRAPNLKLSSFNSVIPAVDSHIKQQQQNCGAGCIYGNWSQQRQISQSSQAVDWCPSSYDKISSTIQQEQCCTPTSTLTSQGSASNCSSQQAPTPGSPNSRNIYSGGRFVSSRTTGTINLHGNLGSEYGTSHLGDSDRDRTLRAQQQPKSSRTTIVSGSTSTRYQIKASIGGSRQDDSANYSLTSSNESAENARLSGQTNRIMDSTEFATSIV